MGVPSPNSTPSDKVVRYLVIPSDPLFIAAMGGAISDLINPESWEQYGSVTPEAAAAVAQEIYLGWERNPMIGAILPYMGPLPNGCIPCDGQARDGLDHPQLFDHLQNTDWINPLDDSQFIVPNLSGRVIRGVDASWIEGSYGGGGQSAGGTGAYDLAFLSLNFCVVAG